MIKIYNMEVSPLHKEEIFNKYCGRVDAERLSKIMRTGTRDSQVRSLAAGLLVQRGVSNWLSGAEGKEEGATLELVYEYGEGGKPYLRDFPEICFNISHSGKFAVCAFSNQEVGIDLQKFTPVNFRLAERFFTNEDNQLLRNDETLFSRMWCVKESFIKLTGKGMKQGLDTFHINWEDESLREQKEGGEEEAAAYFKELNIIPGYACCVCSTEKIEEYENITIYNSSTL